MSCQYFAPSKSAFHFDCVVNTSAVKELPYSHLQKQYSATIRHVGTNAVLSVQKCRRFNCVNVSSNNVLFDSPVKAHLKGSTLHSLLCLSLSLLSSLTKENIRFFFISSLCNQLPTILLLPYLMLTSPQLWLLRYSSNPKMLFFGVQLALATAYRCPSNHPEQTSNLILIPKQPPRPHYLPRTDALATTRSKLPTSYRCPRNHPEHNSNGISMPQQPSRAHQQPHTSVPLQKPQVTQQRILVHCIFNSLATCQWSLAHASISLVLFRLCNNSVSS